MTIASMTMAIHTENTSNKREHFRARARRIANERAEVALWWVSEHGREVRAAKATRPLVVRLTRWSAGTLDSDGLHSALKAVRDEVAAQLGVDDKDGTDGVTWAVDQKTCKRREHYVTVALEAPGATR